MELSKKNITLFIGIAVLAIFFVKCPLQEMFGIPCPGCNMTTAFYYLCLGEIKTAFFYHPLVFVLLLCIFIEIMLFIKYQRFDSKYAKWVLWIFLILMLAVYIYRMIVVFPQIPMVYVEDNFINRIKTLFF